MKELDSNIKHDSFMLLVEAGFILASGLCALLL